MLSKDVNRSAMLRDAEPHRSGREISTPLMRAERATVASETAPPGNPPLSAEAARAADSPDADRRPARPPGDKDAR
jgi:hypothetical protein